MFVRFVHKFQGIKLDIVISLLYNLLCKAKQLYNALHRTLTTSYRLQVMRKNTRLQGTTKTAKSEKKRGKKL